MSRYGTYFNGRHVLVTGGLGFIGINLCQRLLGLGAEFARAVAFYRQ